MKFLPRLVKTIASTPFSEWSIRSAVSAVDGLPVSALYSRFVIRTEWIITPSTAVLGKRLSLSVEGNMEKATYVRKRIPVEPRKLTDAPIEGHRL